MYFSDWRISGSRVRGSSHKRKGIECQDAISWKKSQEYLILAVADGHGSKKSTKSSIGSKLAVGVAINTLSKLYLEAKDRETRLKDYWSSGQVDLPQAIERRWKLKARKYHQAQRKINHHRGDDFDIVKYGTTLLSVLVTEDFILYFQLGDGDILEVMNDGEVRWVFEPEDSSVGNETTSLCQNEAWKEVQTNLKVLNGFKPDLILVSTDGYSNSFEKEEGFLKIGPDYLQQIEESGLDEVEQNLDDWLMETSRHGSGDDITLGLIYNQK